MSHVSWEYYSSLFDKVSQEAFEKAEKRAEMEIANVIGPRWKSITEETYGYDKLQICICRAIDKMAENEESGKGKGISSASNDGYSESYAIQTEEQLRSELYSSIKAWLSGTGLVGAY